MWRILFGDSYGSARSKGLLQSKTFYGVVVVAVAWGFKSMGLEVADPAIQATAENVIALLGAALAIYGRVKAETKIG